MTMETIESQQDGRVKDSMAERESAHIYAGPDWSKFNLYFSSGKFIVGNGQALTKVKLCGNDVDSVFLQLTLSSPCSLIIVILSDLIWKRIYIIKLLLHCNRHFSVLPLNSTRKKKHLCTMCNPQIII